MRASEEIQSGTPAKAGRKVLSVSCCVSAAASLSLFITATPASAVDGPVVDLNKLVAQSFTTFGPAMQWPENQLQPESIQADCSKVYAENSQAVDIPDAAVTVGPPVAAPLGRYSNTTSSPQSYTTESISLSRSKTATTQLSHGVSVSTTVAVKASPNSVGTDFSLTTAYTFNKTTSTSTTDTETRTFPSQSMTVRPGNRGMIEVFYRPITATGQTRISGNLKGTCTVRWHGKNSLTAGNYSREYSVYTLLGPSQENGNPRQGGAPALPAVLSLSSQDKVVKFNSMGSYNGVGGFIQDVTTTELPPDRWGQISGYGGSCLDAAGTDAPVQYRNCASSSMQWRYDSNGTLRASNGQCLSTVGTWNGAPARLRSCDGTPEQQWRPRQGLGDIYNPYSDRCLDDYAWNTDNGAPQVVWNCNGYPNQKWSFS